MIAAFRPPAACADGDYQPGHGVNIGAFNFAGYANLIANLPQSGPRALTLDDLSLYVTGHVSKLINPFFETELTGLDLAHSGSRAAGDGDGDLVLERVYNDSYLSENITLRLGKMLAPVGAWNEIHAAPLVLSAVRPAVTYRNFSEYASGASILYTDPDGRWPDVQLYWQPDVEFSERPTNVAARRYERVSGLHVAFASGLFDNFGVSFQQAHDERGFSQSLYGFDLRFTSGQWTLQGEATFSDISDSSTTLGRDTEWGGYAAASYALTEDVSLYGWYEGFADRTADKAAHDLLFGVAYRPRPAMVLRLEYLQNLTGESVNPTGIVASWSVLF